MTAVAHVVDVVESTGTHDWPRWRWRCTCGRRGRWQYQSPDASTLLAARHVARAEEATADA